MHRPGALFGLRRKVAWWLGLMASLTTIAISVPIVKSFVAGMSGLPTIATGLLYAFVAGMPLLGFFARRGSDVLRTELSEVVADNTNLTTALADSIASQAAANATDVRAFAEMQERWPGRDPGISFLLHHDHHLPFDREQMLTLYDVMDVLNIPDAMYVNTEVDARRGEFVASVGSYLGRLGLLVGPREHDGRLSVWMDSDVFQLDVRMEHNEHCFQAAEELNDLASKAYEAYKRLVMDGRRLLGAAKLIHA